MLYTSGQNVLTREQLARIPVPDRGRRSERWEGVQHGDLANEIIAGCGRYDLKVLNEGWYCNPLQSDLFGVVDIDLNSPGMETRGLHLDIGQEATFSLGVRHGNTGHYSVSFAVGGRVGVCSNGIFTGDFLIKHRHTSGVNNDLPGVISEGIERYLVEVAGLESMVNGYRDVEIDDRDAAYLCMTAMERGSKGFLNHAHLKDVWGNWVDPKHEEFEPRTAWSYYNAVTEKLKDLTPPRQVRAMRGLRPMIDDFIGRN